MTSFMLCIETTR